MRIIEQSGSVDLGHEDRIAEEVATKGWSVCENFIDPELIERLVADTRLLWEAGDFDFAQVGQGQDKQRCPSVRSDWIHWLEDFEWTNSQREYIDALEKVRLAINRATMMGLFEWEGHLAVYPPGTFYRRHLDVFRQAQERKISTILYLNQEWTPVDGGELRLYLDGAEIEPYLDVTPEAGTLVSFLSDVFYHEVLAAHQERMSVTGWFRVRS